MGCEKTSLYIPPSNYILVGPYPWRLEYVFSHVDLLRDALGMVLEGMSWTIMTPRTCWSLCVWTSLPFMKSGSLAEGGEDSIYGSGG